MARGRSVSIEGRGLDQEGDTVGEGGSSAVRAELGRKARRLLLGAGAPAGRDGRDALPRHRRRAAEPVQRIDGAQSARKGTPWGGAPRPALRSLSREFVDALDPESDDCGQRVVRSAREPGRQRSW